MLSGDTTHTRYDILNSSKTRVCSKVSRYDILNSSKTRACSKVSRHQTRGVSWRWEHIILAQCTTSRGSWAGRWQKATPRTPHRRRGKYHTFFFILSITHREYFLSITKERNHTLEWDRIFFASIYLGRYLSPILTTGGAPFFYVNIYVNRSDNNTKGGPSINATYCPHR